MKGISVCITWGMLILFSCQAQEKEQEEQSEEAFIRLSESVLDLRNKIAAFNEVQDSHIGYGALPSEQYGNYEDLLEIATDNELYSLTGDTNYTVATYATYGLIERENTLFVDVFQNFLKEDKEVRTMSGCLVGEDLVSSLIYFKYWNKVRFESDEGEAAIESDETLLKLDSLILVADDAYWLLYDRAFSNRVFPPNYLYLTEKQAFKNKNIYAIEYLFQHNPSDYSQQIIDALKAYLNKEDIWPIHYDKLYAMSLSYKNEDLNKRLVLELEDIEKAYGEKKRAKYEKMLLNKKVKIE